MVPTMPNAGWPTLLAALSFPLITNLSTCYLVMFPAALQVLVRTARCLQCPCPVTHFSLLTKAALLVFAMLDELS